MFLQSNPVTNLRLQVCADIDDFQLKLVKLEGEFVWHHHDDEDELFLVKSGLYANSVPASSIFDPNGA